MQLPVEFLRLLNELQGRMQQHKTKHGKCQKNLQMVLVLTGMLGIFIEGCSGFSSGRVKLALEVVFGDGWRSCGTEGAELNYSMIFLL